MPPNAKLNKYRKFEISLKNGLKSAKLGKTTQRMELQHSDKNYVRLPRQYLQKSYG